MSWLSSLINGFTGKTRAHAATKAAGVEAGAIDQGIGAVQQQGQVAQQALAPFQKTGVSALGGESDLLGLNGGGPQQASIDALKASPLYQSLFHNGQEAVLANASATGGLRGGNVQHSLANFGTDTLAQVIQQHLQNLGGLSSQGLAAAGTQGELGQGNAGQLAALFGAKGAVQGGGIRGQADAYSGMSDFYKQLLFASSQAAAQAAGAGA